MKVIHLNYSDISGGAGRAAYRIHHCLRGAGVDSQMWVNKATAGDWTVQGPTTKFEKVLTALRPRLVGPLVKALRTENPIIHSPCLLPSQWVKRINSSDADLVHLHWVQGEMLSIADIAKIKKPMVWTLHDMWAFCGAEHYTSGNRWREGYNRSNRPAHESGFDLNRWAWLRKRKHWRQPIQLVTPSRWLAQCVKESALMCDWPVTVIPNPIDLERFAPLDQSLARQLLGLPQDLPLVLFGALGGCRDPRKGFDLLQAALNDLRGQVHGMQLVVFGQIAPKDPPDFGFPIHYTGQLHDDFSLRAVYSAADVFALPSRQDNLPNTGVEALACGTPVVAFDTCGLPDIVEHRHTGYLAQAFDTEDLAAGIRWVLAESQRREPGPASGIEMRKICRQRAVDRFSPTVVEPKQRSVNDTILQQKQ
jgi:glycosyltransferase involved in cell wall biosynthesis